jgi:uncharacterized membrane protein
MKVHKLHFSFCHQKPERSFFWKGKQLPVCARCTGIHLGYLSFPIFLFSFWTVSLFWTLILIIPTLIDGLTQAYWKRESNNLLRVVTGLMAGIGTMSLISISGKFIGNQILLLIQ